MRLSSTPLALIVAAVVACGERAPATRTDTAHGAAAQSCDARGVRDVVEQLGERMKRVSLQAPDTVVARELRDAYAPLVTPELLAAWLAAPTSAPGREVSSPWPERIEIRSAQSSASETCRVTGDVVYVTSADVSRGGAASRELVVLDVRHDGGWRISAYEKRASASPPADSTDADHRAAADVVRRYYAAIDARDYRRAYELWGSNGAASKQTFAAFAAGFRHTARVRVDVGQPGRIEAAAGSRYVDVPVVVHAVTDAGEEQRFEGTYVLRRSVVDGASPAQREWRIYSAKVARQ